MMSSKVALMEMQAWAKDSYRRAIMPKDANFWKERIEVLRELV